MTRSDYFRPVRGGISGLCEEADDNPLSPCTHRVVHASCFRLQCSKLVNKFDVVLVLVDQLDENGSFSHYRNLFPANSSKIWR